MGVELDALLAGPGQQAGIAGQRLDGGVGNCRARPEHDQAELVDRQWR